MGGRHARIISGCCPEQRRFTTARIRWCRCWCYPKSDFANTTAADAKTHSPWLSWYRCCCIVVGLARRADRLWGRHSGTLLHITCLGVLYGYQYHSNQHRHRRLTHRALSAGPGQWTGWDVIIVAIQTEMFSLLSSLMCPLIERTNKLSVIIGGDRVQKKPQQQNHNSGNKRRTCEERKCVWKILARKSGGIPFSYWIRSLYFDGRTKGVNLRKYFHSIVLANNTNLAT